MSASAGDVQARAGDLGQSGSETAHLQN